MQKRNDALTPVISAILALLIVTSIIGSILLWGVPYMEQLDKSAKKEEADKQFVSALEAINDLAKSNPGERKINQINTEEGYIYVDEDDRTIISYSYSEDYNFTVSGLDPCSPDTCFLRGTKVLMADDSYKNIEDVDVDDIVLSFDEETKVFLPCRVSRVFSHLSEEMTRDYYLVINHGLRVTPNHRFYSDGRWVYADDLRVGDPLFPRKQNQDYIVYSIDRVYEREASFDLEVERCHTYFVLVPGDVDVLVHNDDYSGFVWVTPDWYEEVVLGWKNENNARDNNEGSYAKYDRLHKDWSKYLILTMNTVIPCCGFRIKAKYNSGLDEMEVVMYNGTDQVKYTSFSSWNDPEWQECDYGANFNIDKVKIRFLNTHNWFESNEARVFEFDFKVPIPECQTLVATDVNETSAKLHGMVTDDQGKACNYRFEYDTDPSMTDPDYYFTTWSGTVSNGEIFSRLIPQEWPPQPDLTSGELYYFRAQVGHQGGDNTGSGEVLTFITQPYAPSNIQYTSTDDSISYSWTKATCGTGATVYTKVLAKTSGWPSDPEDNTAIEWYNGTGSSATKDNNLDPGQRYNVSMWTWAEEGGIGSWSDSHNVAMYTKPSGLPYLHAENVSATKIKLTWIKGEGADKTVIRRSTTSFPSTPTDGVEVYNDTGELWIDTVEPVENYFYSAWAYDRESGYFSDGNATAYVEMVYNIVVNSPREDDTWKRRTTQMIKWAYGSNLSGSTVNITLHGNDANPEVINDAVLINDGEYSWSIPPGQDIGRYRIKITSNFDGDVYDYSSYFYIRELHEGIIDNVTIWGLDVENGAQQIDLPNVTWRGHSIKDDESFLLTMKDGKTTRIEVYWLAYYEGELEEPYSLRGAICIDLHNDDDVNLEDDGYRSGSSWILDSDSVTYEFTSSSGANRVIIENGGIIHSEAGDSYLQKEPSFVYEGEKIFSMHVVQTVAAAFSGSGTGGLKFRMYSNLYSSNIRETGQVYNLRLQFYGDNNETWLEYFKDNYDFTEESVESDMSLFYNPSDPADGGVWFAFAHSAIELSIR